MLDITDENLAVAKFAGARRFGDGLDTRLHLFIIDH